MQEIEFNFYTSLKNDGSVTSSNTPNIVLRSDIFKSLVDASIIEKIRKGRGFIYKVSKVDSFNSFYGNAFPNPEILITNEIDNQLKFKNTKASVVEKETIIFIRGKTTILVNGSFVDLHEFTTKFGLFSALLQEIKADKICFVENLQPFFIAEKLLGDEYTYIHFYGRLPKSDKLKRIKCKEYLHLGDYDFTGLHEFLRASDIYENSHLYMPENFEYLFQEYATKRKEKDTQHKNVKVSEHPDVIRVREKVKTTNLFLEQQILFRETL